MTYTHHDCSKIEVVSGYVPNIAYFVLNREMLLLQLNLDSIKQERLNDIYDKNDILRALSFIK